MNKHTYNAEWKKAVQNSIVIVVVAGWLCKPDLDLHGVKL